MTKKKGHTNPSEEKIQNASSLTLPIVQEMQQSYLDYAMSVIVSRALPDVRDGLKPVHRRILYAMWSVGLRAQSKFRKSATVVGEVLGKYHPHGDAAVYDALVRMAQDFSLRYPLVEGQGNFGSMDGDSPAAMRYTEAKLTPIAEELLFDIEKDTVDFMSNYDGSQKEPIVLPAKLPNLLLNGAMGIAVGMATSIPPHNLNELCDGIIHLIDHPEATIDDLMEYIQGPDFPTGATIYDVQEIRRAYTTGKGVIVTKANAEIVEEKGQNYKIIVREIPFQVNKAGILEKIADLVKEKKIEGIRDLRDESSEKEGVRIVIDLKKDAYPKKVLNRLYKLTPLQDTFHVNMLALVDGIQPRVLTLKMILEEYIQHREAVVRRRTEYDLRRAKERAHILKGLKIALVHINKIIDTIKKSHDRDVAKKNLMKRFSLTERQAIAILEMRLQQLAGLERIKVEQELKEKLALIKELESVLKSTKKIREIIKKELREIKEKYADERKTKIVAKSVKEFTVEDLVPDEDIIVVVTRDGYTKSVSPDLFRTQLRGGKGVIGLATREGDIVEHFFTTTMHSFILFFSSKGRVFQLRGYDIPRGSRTSRGQAMVNFLQVSPQETISAVMPLSDLDGFRYLVMVTKMGNIKRVNIADFKNVRKTGLIAIKLKSDDELRWVKPSSGNDEVILVTALGQAIRFSEKDIRVMGRSAAGVRGIRLKKGDEVVGMDIISKAVIHDSQLLVVMEKGYGKRTHLKWYKKQSRGGLGIKTAKVTSRTGNIISALVVNAKTLTEDLVMITEKGQVIRLPIKSINVLGRSTQGVRLMKFQEGSDEVASITLV